MKVVDIVTIAELIPIFKNGESANTIQVARIKDSDGSSCQFNIIVGKGLYEIGDTVVYIQPDYCIPNTELFKEYYAPQNDIKKSKLGKKGRVKAVKFGFNFYGEEDPIYSNGVILPLKEVKKWLDKNNYKGFNPADNNDDSLIISYDINQLDLQSELHIIKYEADVQSDGMNKGLIKGDLISAISISDETRIENLYEKINIAYEDGEILSATLKRDGSAIYVYVILENEDIKFGVCSRKLEKKLEQEYVSAYKDGDIILHPYFDKTINQKGWMNDYSKIFYSDEQVKQFEEITTISKDAWVDTVKENGYLDKLIEYAKKYNISIELKGELIGDGVQTKKKNNDSKGKKKVIWYGSNTLKDGRFIRNHYNDFHNLKQICTELQMEYTEELWEGVFSYEDIIKKCNEYFKIKKEKENIVVEGIVLRTKFSNRLSFKYINPEYDASH